MNWYKSNIKLASVTFAIPGSDKFLKPMTTFDIAWDIAKFIHNKGYAELPWETVTIDGYDMDAFTGPLNFYMITPQITKEFVQKIISAYNTEKNGLITVTVGEAEKSGVRNSNVIRMNVTYNETEYMEDVPQMNLSNTNAIALLEVLEQEGMNVNPEILEGSLDIDALDHALSMIRAVPSTSEQLTTETVTDGNHISVGRSAEQVESYIERLEQMVDFINNNGIKDRRVTFG